MISDLSLKWQRSPGRDGFESGFNVSSTYGLGNRPRDLLEEGFRNNFGK
jgi:hypothetical protein